MQPERSESEERKNCARQRHKETRPDSDNKNDEREKIPMDFAPPPAAIPFSRHMGNSYCILLGAAFVAITGLYLYITFTAMLRSVVVMWNGDAPIGVTPSAANTAGKDGQHNALHLLPAMDYGRWERDDSCSEYDIFDLSSSLLDDLENEEERPSQSGDGHTERKPKPRRKRLQQTKKKTNGKRNGGNGKRNGGNGRRKAKNGRGRGRGNGSGSGSGDGSGAGKLSKTDKAAAAKKKLQRQQERLQQLQQQQQLKKGSTAEPIIYLFALVFIYLLLKAMSDINQHYKSQTKDGKRVRRCSLQSYAQANKQERRASKAIPFRAPPKL